MKLFAKISMLFVITGLFSCSGTKCLQQNQELYVGSKLILKQKTEPRPFVLKYSGVKYSKAYISVWDLPNGSLFGFPSVRGIPIRLIMYNWFYNEKSKGFNYWMRNNLGEEPVLMDDIQPELKLKRLIEIFEGFGHFGTTGHFEIHYRRNKKKAFVKYSIEIAEAFKYRNVEFLLDPTQAALQNSMDKRKKHTVIRTGLEYNLDTLRNEKLELFKQLRNDGFFYIQPSDIIIEADTIGRSKVVDIRIRINNNLTQTKLSKVSINRFLLTIDSVDQKKRLGRYYNYLYGKLRKSFLDSIIFINSGDVYSLSKSMETIDLLSSLGIFKSNSLAYDAVEGDSANIAAKLSLNTSDATLLSFDVKGSYKTAGYIGPSLGFKVTQLNLFGGAENLYVEADYYYDFPIGIFRERISRSSGVSVRSILKAPFASRVVKLPRTSNSLPFQFASLNLEYNDRKEYFRMFSWNASYGFEWNKSKYSRHRLDLVNITFSDLLETTARFDTLVLENPSLRTSLVNQFIVGTAYTYILDKRSEDKVPSGMFFQGRFETAGNSLVWMNRLFTDDTQGNRTVFNLPISQFIQLSYDYRYYFKTGRLSSLVFRHIGGFGIAYGNSTQMPYIKQYFIGGTNSLRPINARSVGPGRYLEFNEGEVNQVGDIKLEMNLEYRFSLGVRLKGAFWTDAGNIWLLREDPERPNSGIRWGKIIEDSYLTAGTGLRLDVDYLILRLDYGFLLYAPIFIEGSKWIWQNKLPLSGIVIGFGYPF